MTRKTASDVLVDSSVWLGYLLSKKENARAVIDKENIIKTSILSLFEIKRRLIRYTYSLGEIEKMMQFINERSIVLGLTTQLTQEAAELSCKHNLHAMDALIYATAVKNNLVLITCDNDFRGLDGVIIL